MKPSSAKAKGRRLQDEVRKRILSTFPKLEEDDVKTAIMGESGEDIRLSPAARKMFPFSVECKNVEKLNTYQSWGQAVANAGSYTPLLIHTRNRHETLVTFRFDDLLTLLYQDKDETS